MSALDNLGDEAPQPAVDNVVEVIPHTLKAHLAREAALKQAQGGTGPIPQLQRVKMGDGDQDDEPSPEVVQFAREMMIFNGLASLNPNLYHVSEALRNVEYRRLQSAIPPLIAALEAYGASPEPLFNVWLSMAQTLIYAAFGVKPDLDSEPQPPADDGRELTSDQRAVLRALAESEPLWRSGGNARLLLEPLGLPYERARLRALLSA